MNKTTTLFFLGLFTFCSLKGLAQNHAPYTDIARNIQIAKEHFDSTSYDSTIQYSAKAIEALRQFSKKERDTIWLRHFLTGINSLTKSHLEQNQFQEAVNLGEEAIEALSPQDNTQPQELAELYHTLGKAYFGLRNAKAAADKLEQSIDIKMSLKKEADVDMANSFSNLGYAHYYSGNYFKGYLNLKKALELVEAKEDKVRDDSLFMAELNNSVGKLLYELGYCDEAALKFQKCLSLRLELKSTDGQIAQAYNGVGVCYVKKGAFDKALDYYNKAEKLWTSSFGKALGNYQKGLVYARKDKHEESLPYFEKAIKVCEEKEYNDLLAAAYQSSCGVLLKLEETESALAYATKSVEVAQKAYPVGDPKIAKAYIFLGRAYRKKQDFDQSVVTYNKAVEIFKNKHFDRHPDLATTLYGMASAYEEKGDYWKALNYCQEALAVFLPNLDKADYYSIEPFRSPNRAGSSEHLMLDILKKKATLLYQLQEDGLLAEEKNDFAFNKMMAASNFIDTIRGNHIEDEMKLKTVNELFPFIDLSIQTLVEGGNQFNTYPYINQLFEAFEKSKSISLLEKLAQTEAISFSAVPEEILQQERHLKFQTLLLEKQIYQENSKVEKDEAIIAHAEQQILKLNQQYNDLINQINEDYHQYYQLKHNLNVANIHQIQREVLQSDQSLIEYYLTDTLLFAFCIAKDSFYYQKQQIDSNFFAQIDLLQNVLRNPPTSHEPKKKDFVNFTTASRYLYKKLLAPILSKAGMNTQNLIIIPDGELSYLPFEILLYQDPKKADIQVEAYEKLPYLFLEHHLLYEYSATVLLEKPSRSQQAQLKYAGFAPDYSSNQPIAMSRGDSVKSPLHLSRATYAPLPGARQEIITVAKLLDLSPYLDAAASKDNFLKIAPDAAVIHLAMHGEVHDKEPLYSKLIFTPTTDSLDAYQLYAYELYNMQLRADLAVLSACNTGYGEIQRGEGVMSLSRAFKYAGCPNIVMSLWQANDKSSKQIMLDFFEGLKANQRKDVALHTAQAAYLKRIQEGDLSFEYGHPHYWANFVLVGDGNKVEFGRHINWKWALAGVLIIGVLLFWWRKGL